MDIEDLKKASHVVTGMKQTVKAADGDKIRHIFIAKDADERVVRPVLDVCSRKNIPVTMVDTMEELGKACKIKVNAAMAAILLEG